MIHLCFYAYCWNIPIIQSQIWTQVLQYQHTDINQLLRHVQILQFVLAIILLLLILFEFSAQVQGTMIHFYNPTGVQCRWTAFHRLIVITICKCQPIHPLCHFHLVPLLWLVWYKLTFFWWTFSKTLSLNSPSGVLFDRSYLPISKKRPWRAKQRRLACNFSSAREFRTISTPEWYK